MPPEAARSKISQNFLKTFSRILRFANCVKESGGKFPLHKARRITIGGFVHIRKLPWNWQGISRFWELIARQDYYGVIISSQKSRLKKAVIGISPFLNCWSCHHSELMEIWKQTWMSFAKFKICSFAQWLLKVQAKVFGITSMASKKQICSLSNANVSKRLRLVYVHSFYKEVAYADKNQSKTLWAVLKKPMITLSFIVQL